MIPDLAAEVRKFRGEAEKDPRAIPVDARIMTFEWKEEIRILRTAES